MTVSISRVSRAIHYAQAALSLPLTVLAFILPLIVTIHGAFGEEAAIAELLADLRSDSIPGNASRALRALDPRWGGSRKLLREHIGVIEKLTRDADAQMRQNATYLLVKCDPERLAPESISRAEFLGMFVDGLVADDISHNANHACRILGGEISGGNSVDIRDLLKPLLHSPDHQARQLATYLTVMSYREEDIPEDKWDPAAIENMVVGLRNDNIRSSGGTIPNAADFFGFLFEMKENWPIHLGRTELAGEDNQSRYAAAMLLARWQDRESGATIRTLLLPSLEDDDRWSHNALPAYQALVWYGRENTLELLDGFRPDDWQVAALVVCVAAFHGVTPAFVTDALRKEWLARIQEFESAAPERRYARNCDAKIAAAALYLDPGAPPFLSKIGVPPYLQRMLNAGDRTAPAPERAKWMAQWFPMLDPSYQRVSMLLLTGAAAHNGGAGIVQ